MPVFILLLFLGVAVLWLLLSFCFIPIGKFVSRLIKDAKTSMSKDDFKEKSEEEKDGTEQIAASLTPELIDKIMYEKWNGELPTVSGSNAIVSMEGLK